MGAKASTCTRGGAGRRVGFTLIEIIAVLVILAVLTAVAIPRYLSLSDMARDQALNNALAAGFSHVSLAFGRLALQNGGQAPTAAELAAVCNADPPQSADYVYAFGVAAGGGVDVTVAESGDAARNTTREWHLP